LINWVTPGNFDATENNAPTWTSLLGYQGNGIDQSLSTGYTPSIHADNYAQDSAAFGVVSRTEAIEARNDIGAQDAPGALLFTRQTATQAGLRLNNNNTYGFSGGGTAIGLLAGNRILSTHMEYWANGVRRANLAATSTGVPTNEFGVLWNGGNNWSTHQISMAFVGGGLTSDQMIALNTAWTTYDTIIVNRLNRSDEYNTVYDAMTNKPSEAVAAAQDAMVISLVADGVWAKLDFLYILANETNADSEALINWINPGTYDGVAYNSPTFTSLEGFTGNGSNAYISTGYIPSVHADNYNLASASFGVYSRTNKSEATYDMSAASGTAGDASLYLRASGDVAGFRVNNDTTSSCASTNSSGFFIADRYSYNAMQLWRNGATLAAPTGISATDLPDVEFKLFTTQYGNYSTRQLSVAFAGQYLNSIDVGNFTDAIETYMDSNSKGVIS